jgi:hypothetical protein
MDVRGPLARPAAPGELPMAAPSLRPAEPKAPPAIDTGGDVDPPDPLAARRFRIVLQLWVIFFLLILVAGLANFLWYYVAGLIHRIAG